MTRTLAAALLGVAVATGLTACHDATPTTDAAAAAPADPPASSHGSAVHLDASQLAQVRIEELSASGAADAIKATGTVEFNADRTAKVLPPVAGQVLDLAVNVGDTVRRNDVLFVISSREVASAVADHVASHKDLELAEKTFAMTQDLFEHQAASRIALQQSENELAKAKSKVLQTQEVLEVLGIDDRHDDAMQMRPHVQVRAPIGGTVIERSVTSGQFVGPDTAPLLTIADLSTVWVQADVFERDLHSIAAGQKADVTTAAYPADHFSAQVARIGTVVDAQTRTAKMRFVVANPGFRLKPGMFTTAELQLPSQNNALTAPAKAVFVENSRSYAYVQTSPDTFARRALETLPGGGDRVRITRGLSPGDRIVSDGVLLLRALESNGASQ